MIERAKRTFASWRAWRWLAIWQRRQEAAEAAKRRHLLWWHRAVPSHRTEDEG